MFLTFSNEFYRVGFFTQWIFTILNKTIKFLQLNYKRIVIQIFEYKK